PAQTSTLSLHDALPILARSAAASAISSSLLGGCAYSRRPEQAASVQSSSARLVKRINVRREEAGWFIVLSLPGNRIRQLANRRRSEEHTSELQSRENLV